YYQASAWENNQHANNTGSAALAITYREPDLQVSSISVSNPTPSSGQTITVTWTVTNDGTRATRVNTWSDGVFLSRDDALDNTDYALIDRGTYAETMFG